MASQTRKLQGTEYARFGSAPWQQHAHWLNGLPDEVITALEHRWGVRFPPDYRLFLRRLHAADRPEGVTLPSTRAVPFAMRPPPEERPFFQTFRFYNWVLDVEELREYFAWPLEGLLESVKSSLWRPSWGERPSSLEARESRVRELVAAAPKLIPIFEHRYLLAEPHAAGNPVLSVYGSDIVVYGADLRDYFAHEFAGIAGPSRRYSVPPGEEDRLRAIPFWGELLVNI